MTTTKRCNVCGDEKSFDAFSKDRKAKDGKQRTCKPCASEIASRNYHKYNRRESYGERAKILLKNLREFTNEVRSLNGCAVCEERDTCCLDFHHLDPESKYIEVSVLLRRKNRRRLVAEMLKCVVLCSNCHRKLHAGKVSVDSTQRCRLPEGIVV